MAKKSVLDEYKSLNISPLNKLKQHKGKVLNSMSRLGNMQHPQGWIDECVPNMLWAVIVVATLGQDDYLALFRDFLRLAETNVPASKELFPTHNFLAVASNDEFDDLMKPILSHEDVRKALSALMAVDSLPDRSHWERHLHLDNKADALRFLAAAINDVSDHQSQKSTDLRWLKCMYMIICRDQVRVADHMAYLIEEILKYPNKGDLQAVRPTIRSFELSTRMIEFQTEGTGKNWPPTRSKLPIVNPEDFWNQMLREAPCFVMVNYPEVDFPPEEIISELTETIALLSDHFMKTLKTTKADPRHEGAFALALFAMQIAMSSGSSPGHGHFDGRIALRTVMEVFVVLHYLTKEDNETLWQQYRKYGTGQTKLAFLKYLRADKLPDFINMDELHQIANEDRWMELEDIELGNWAGSNLRKMAEICGLKDVYDRYYDWTSGYVHGQWASARSAVMVNCLNPLHRFHLVPATQMMPMPSVMPDICKFVNRILDDINALYPAFKPRLSAYKKMVEPELSDATEIVEECADSIFKSEQR